MLVEDDPSPCGPLITWANICRFPPGSDHVPSTLHQAVSSPSPVSGRLSHNFCFPPELSHFRAPRGGMKKGSHLEAGKWVPTGALQGGREFSLSQL